MFAAITAKDVSKALKEKDLKVSADLITFEPQKETGTFEAKVNFKSGLDATVTVVIEEK